MMKFYALFLSFCSFSSLSHLVLSQNCPVGWVDFEESCYRFTRSPLKKREEARQYCIAFNAADLISVDTLEEHMFVSKWLRNNDPLHRRWYTSGRDGGDNSWVWDGDATQFSNIDSLWLPDIDYNYYKYAAYNYSTTMNRWGLLKVDSLDELSFICEAPKEQLHQIVIMERTLDYGSMEADEEKLPRGPIFIMEPRNAVFDTSERKTNNDVSLRCVASGYPDPSYTWFKKETTEEETDGRPIDPLRDNRYTQTDGTLSINNPSQEFDRGKYYCQARNVYGTVVSETAQIGFAGISEFTQTRSDDRAKENWGKALSCDAPKATTGIYSYYWTRNSFPNFVQEDARVFVSYDSNLYISSVEKVDEARYACFVKSNASSTGKNGPYFHLFVDSGSSGQKLLFPNNFPKSFPDAPVVGDTVRLECVSYGYPIPSYNWTRKGSHGELPDGSIHDSSNRILILPRVRVEDMGEYTCTASNTLESISKSITLSIQAKPEFTIPLGNKIVDRESTITWTCEAFGIPDVTYVWLRNGKVLNPNDLGGPSNGRYSVNDNVLVIEAVQESDQGMFQCKATNQLGSTYSTGQLRVIRIKPTFMKHPMDSEMYAAYGGNVTLPCKPEAAPLPEFVWKRNGNSVGTGGRIKLLPNGYLFITNVGRDDQGRYSCVVRNNLGSDESEGVLVVLPPPRLIETPGPKERALVNTSFELRCEASVSEMLDLAYIWQFNGLRIDPEIHHQFSLREDRPGYLHIENVTLTEAGHYRCIAKTSIAKVSAETELVVMGPPGSPGAVLAEDLNATSGRVHWSDGFNNGRMIFAYNIQGRTNHNSTWVILATNITYWRNHQETGRKETSLIDVLSPWSTYEFRVSAVNELGQGPPSDPSPQYNTEMDKPHVYPNNVYGGGGKTGSLTITWDPLPPQEWNAPSIWYNIYYKPADSNIEPTKRELKSLGNIGMYAINIGDENYYKQYKVRVQAVNDRGVGPISPEEVIYSAESMPQVPPSSVKAVPFNSTSLNVSWVPLDLSREKIRGKLIGHRIKYWKNGDDPTIDSIILLSRGERPWSLIVGLLPNTEYYVSTMAYNEAGSGPDSEPFLARTFKAAPLRPPTSVRVKATSPTSVMVVWRGVLPSTEEEPISGYKVRYWEADKDYTSAKEVFKYLDGNDLEAIVPGLTSGKVYKLRVMAFSIGGDGKMSSPPWEFRVGEGVMSPLTAGGSKISCHTYQFALLLSICAIFNL